MASPAWSASQTAVLGKERAATVGASVPWYVWWGVLAVTSASIGGAWDVSWHRSIGRDTFWTPAHMAIYACGVIAAVICGYSLCYDVWAVGWDEGGFGECAGVPGAVGSVHRGVGRDRDADVGSVR